MQATQFQVSRSNSLSTCVKQACRSKFCVVASVIASAVLFLGWLGFILDGMGSKQYVQCEDDDLRLGAHSFAL